MWQTGAQRIAHLPAGVSEMLAFVPVSGRGDSLALDPVPAVGQPQRGGAVAAVGDELLPLAIADEAPGERERLEQHAVRRAFVVEREALTLVADQRDAAGMLVPLRPAVPRLHSGEPPQATSPGRAGSGTARA